MVNCSKNWYQIKYPVLTIREICALSVKCRGKFRREKDALEKAAKKQEKIPINIVHQITGKRK
jgi:hypothetical protein